MSNSVFLFIICFWSIFFMATMSLTLHLVTLLYMGHSSIGVPNERQNTCLFFLIKYIAMHSKLV